MGDFYFPFGNKLEKVKQTDTAPNKEVFVLGVYASAVHARWVDEEGNEKVKALAVASEPYIFWKGDDAEKIISSIEIHKELGKLEVPKVKSLNGPSGVALDELFLKPLGYKREQAWLCDLLPESRVNAQQKEVIEKYYNNDIIKKFNLTPASIPDFNEKELKQNAPSRHVEILNELESSGAKTIILLGDLPIRWFLNFFDKRFKKLSDFGTKPETYGKRHSININGKEYSIIPLCHPRNAARLGTFSSSWTLLHENWIKFILTKL